MANLLHFRKTIIDLEGNRLDITIRLSDPFQSGCTDFAIVSDYFPKGRRKATESGCLHERILQENPAYQIFVDLHGSDSKGAPTYSVGNGFYFIAKESEEAAKKFLRITDLEYKILRKAEDEQYFSFLLEDLKIVDRWESEAKKAIAILEDLSGEKFEDNSIKPQYTRLSDIVLEEIKGKIKKGYFSNANITIRRRRKSEAKKAALLLSLKTNFEKKKFQEVQNYEMKKILIKLFSTTSNSILYTHTGTVVLNWNASSTYDKKYTETEFKSFLDVAKENKFLKDLIFELK